MSMKVKEKPRIELDHDVENLYCVTRVVEPEDHKYVTQYLWYTDLMYHDDIADDRFELLNPDDPLTWGAYFVAEWQAEQAMLAAAGKAHDPIVFMDRHGRWYIKQREALKFSKQSTRLSYLWKNSLDWHLSCYPIDMSTDDILSTSIKDSPAAFDTWKEAYEVFKTYTKEKRSG